MNLMKGLALILLFLSIIGCSSRLEPHFDTTDMPCVAKASVLIVSDGYSMGWECLPISLKDGELSMGWDGMTDSEKKGQLVVFVVYLDGPFRGRAYRQREDEGGYYIVRSGKKVYLYSP